MNAPTEPLKWTAPPLPPIDEKIPPIEAESLGGLGQNTDGILAHISPVVKPSRLDILRSATHLKVPKQIGAKATAFEPELLDVRGMFAHSLVEQVRPFSSAQVKENGEAIVGYGQMPDNKARGQFLPAHMVLFVNDIDTGDLAIEQVVQHAKDFYGDVIGAAYSTASSRPENKRWRLLVAPSAPVELEQWVRLQKAFAVFMQARGVAIDTSMHSPKQLSFLPNVPRSVTKKDTGTGQFVTYEQRDPTTGEPLHYEDARFGETLFDVSALTTNAGAALAQVADVEAAEALRQQEQKAERERKAVEREAQRQQALADGGDGMDAITRFKLEHSTESLLETYGYIEDEHKPGHWRSPMQTSTNFSTMVNQDGSWVSRSASDRESGIGRLSKEGNPFGDAFDLYAFYEHENKFGKALAAAGAMYGIRPAAQQPSLSEFTALPVPVLGGSRGLSNPFDKAPGGGIALRSSGDGKGPIASRTNLKKALSGGYCGYRVGYDMFKASVVIQDPGSTEWRLTNDNDPTRFATASDEAGFKHIPTKLMGETLNLVAADNAFDSAIQWLEGLVWDGVPRVNTFLAQGFGAGEGAYQTAVGRYIWSGLAGRVLQPGVKAEMLTVFVSGQGIRKSESIKAMAPEPRVFAELSFKEDEKDCYRRMRGALVVETPELDGLNSKGHAWLKKFLSGQFDQFRENYKEHETRLPRRSLMFGTSNDGQFLTDPTGHRRFLPVQAGETNKASSEWVAENCEQLWAEGAVLFKANGVLFADAERLAKDVHGNFEKPEEWEEVIQDYLALSARRSDGTFDHEMLFSVTEVLRNACGVLTAHITQKKLNSVARCLVKLGYKKVQRRVDGEKPRWVYLKE